MSNVKALFLVLLYQTSLLHNGDALVVFAPTPQRAELGKNIVLPCSFKVNDPVKLQFLAVLWLFKDKEVVRFDNKGTVPNSRLFMNTEDISKGIANMEIRNVTIEDIGKYTCMIIYSPEKDSKDVDLSVYATPSVTIEKVEKEDKPSFTLCSVTGFYPKNITVNILKDHSITDESVLSNFHMHADGTYSVNRTWEIPPDAPPKFLSCTVHHETLTPPLQKDLQLAYQGLNDDGPNVGAIVGSIFGVLILLGLILAVYFYRKKAGSQKFAMSDIESRTWIDGEKTTLSCKAFNCTGDPKVTWIVQLKDGTRHEVNENRTSDKEEEEPLMSREYEVTNESVSDNGVNTKLTFIPSRSRHMETSVTCRISDDKIMMEKEYKPTYICVKPEMMPVKSTLSHQGEVELSVNFHKFYPEKMQINWFSKRGKSQENIKSDQNTTNNGDNTFNLESKCNISGERFKDPEFTVMVTWSHESMDGPQSQELSVRDLPWCPKQQNISIESEVQGDEVLLKCSVSDYFPDALAVKWFESKKDGQDLVEVSNSEKYKTSKVSSSRNENGTFSSRADLSYRRSDLPEKGIIFICRVEHPSLHTPIQSSSFQYRDTVTAVETATFSINNIYGPHTWYDGEKVTLYCGASYCMEKTQVIWSVIEAGGAPYDISETTSVEDAKSVGLHPPGYVAHRERSEASDTEGLLDVTSSLTFTPSISKHQNVTIACKIVDSDGKSKKKTFQYKNLYAKPVVSGPIKLSLIDSGEVLCSLDIEKFYPSGIQIKWNDKETLDPATISPNNDGTHSIHSEHKLSGSFFHHPDSAVKVSWKHVSMEDWETRQISVLDKEFPWKPEVQDISVPNLFNGNMATLKCEVSNVFPDVLNVRWLKKEKDSEEIFPLIHSDANQISELRPEKKKDNTFKYKLCLKFKPSIITDGGAEYICRVEHPSLKEAAEKSTGPLTIQDEKKFIVGEIKGPQRWIHGESISLYCPVSYCSKETRVMWKVEHKDGRVEEISPKPDSGYELFKEIEQSDKEKMFNISSSLTFVPSVSKHLGVTVTCSVSFDGQTKIMKFQPESINAKLQTPNLVKTSLCDGGDVLCSMSLQNVYPKDVKLSWRSGEHQLTSREEYKENKDGTFTGHSHCTVPGNILLDPNFILHVTWSHKSLDGEQSQDLSWRNLRQLWCPVIEKVPIPHIQMGQHNTLQYNISGYFPDAVTVSWYRKEKEGQEYIPLQDIKDYQIADIQSQRQPDLTYSCTVRLLFKPSVKDRESEIMCRVSHPCLEKSTEMGSGPLQVQAKPKTRKPIKPSLGIGEMVFLQILENFYPKDIHIDWHYWSGENLEQRCPSEKKYATNINKTFSVESKCKVPEELLSSPDFRVRVTWRHESMDEEEFRELSIRDKDFTWRPKVEMSVPPLRIGEEATIQCRVTKYFPNAVTITWFIKDNHFREMRPVSSDQLYKINNIPIERPKDNTYGGTSCLTFIPSLERDQGAEYVCVVGHPSLEQPIEKSTGALQVTGPEQQNQLLQHEDNRKEQQDPNLPDTVVKMSEVDSAMPSGPEPASLVSSAAIYEKNQNKLEHFQLEQQNQLPRPEDNWEVHQDHKLPDTVVSVDTVDSEMPSDTEEASLDSSGATYAKHANNRNKPKYSSQQYGPRHAMHNAKEKSTKKGASDQTYHKLQQSKDLSDP